MREQEAAVEEIGRRLARQRRDGDVVNRVRDPGRRRRARPRHVLRRGVDTERRRRRDHRVQQARRVPGPAPEIDRPSRRQAGAHPQEARRAGLVRRREQRQSIGSHRCVAERVPRSRSRSATGSVVSSAVCWLMARRGARPATASLSASHIRGGAPPWGASSRWSDVTAKVVAPGSEEVKASIPAPIRRRSRSLNLRDQKLRTHDHDAFQASQIGAARQRTTRR